ncbi:MAG: hypothetical protein K2R93_09280 [Gemmatimonadaceae bacterium]|nr:hypothetical protein [Gemmatimonadaceae bacterium]
MRQSGAEQAKAAEKLANDAIAAAQRELAQAKEGQTNVRVEQGAAGITISIPDEDGDPQVIVLSRDGHQIKSIENMSASAIMPKREPNEMPKSVMIVTLFAIAAGVMIMSPLVRSLTRLLDRRVASPMSNDSAQRLAAIEQAVEAVAVEVERISEGQRFTAKLLSERAKDAVEVR